MHPAVAQSQAGPRDGPQSSQVPHPSQEVRGTGGEGEGGAHPTWRCDRCQGEFATRKALASHSRLAHGDRDPWRDFVTDERCPACARVYSKASEAKRHFSLRLCPESREAVWEERVTEASITRLIAVAATQARGRGRGGGRSYFERERAAVAGARAASASQRTLPGLFGSQRVREAREGAGPPGGGLS